MFDVFSSGISNTPVNVPTTIFPPSFVATTDLYSWVFCFPCDITFSINPSSLYINWVEPIISTSSSKIDLFVGIVAFAGKFAVNTILLFCKYYVNLGLDY